MSDRSRRAAAPAVSIGDRKVVERGSEHRFNHIHEGTFGIQGMDLLSRKVGPISAKSGNTVFVVGTYFLDRNAVFVNARLVRGNGEVLRTAQVMLPSSAMTRR